MGCKTKKVLKTESQETEKTEEVLKSKTVEKEEVKNKTSVESKEEKKEDKKEEKTDINISGKVDKENPFNFYNVVDGDTIDLFKITGKADFIFKSSKSTQKSTLNNKSSDNTSDSRNSERTISNAVENVKNTVKKVQTKTVEVVKKDFTIGSYFVFFLWGLAAIALLIIILWIRKSNPFQFITKYFKN
jgi:hypothetical protein